ncbi:TetR family transcriptional regulator C-terminal domain-containing protein [Pseudoalteromonas sp. MMG010]|uniref:TetR/AcrR family transcriptional regulator n=1 Tax=Pseudoalteromonas sp. MMG010 TaxID=2822685 RepID=UPI001B3A1783|nr:TetR/AcrR family transcriptional regulator [Pseudoalteromonas sp. MMG010]MBQ4832909.1 TetR family transcriptional regulator C-terminal domain-containing protein [Pseudoalteromonas sp. MMG010]
MTTEIKLNKKEVTREKNQQLILNAAEQLFSQLGYDGASMSMIAKAAQVPKANILYYFKSKDGLYEAVIDRIVVNWNLGLNDINATQEPAIVLYNYIKNKVSLSIAQPLQSRLFAGEVLRGAPYLQNYISSSTRPWVKKKAALFQSWIDQGKIDSVNPYHLLFTIWSTTQYYADFQSEVLLILDKKDYTPQDITEITDSIAQIILKGIGLSVPTKNE